MNKGKHKHTADTELSRLRNKFSNKPDSLSESQRNRLKELLASKKEKRGLTANEQDMIRRLGMSRRNFLRIGLGVGSATLIGSVYGIGGLLQDESTDKSAQGKLVEKPKEIKKSEDSSEQFPLPEWAKEIELPKVEFSDEPFDWSEEKKAQFYLPDGMSAEKSKVLTREFEGKFLKTRHLLEKANDLEKRIQILDNFLFSLIEGFLNLDTENKIKGEEIKLNTPQFWQVWEKVSRTLAFNDIFVSLGKFADFTFHKVKRLGRCRVQNAENNVEVPIMATTEDWWHFSAKNKLSMKDIGTYYDLNNAIVMHQHKGASALGDLIRTISPDVYRNFMPSNVHYERLKKAYTDAHVFHEGAHAALSRIYKFPIRQGDVAFGRVPKINFADLPIEFQTATAREIHELGSVGFGLMNAGISAKLYALNAATITKRKAYWLSSLMLRSEITNLPNVSDELKDQIHSNALKGKKMGRVMELALAGADDDQLFFIGEKMAKLCLYLIQQEKK